MIFFSKFLLAYFINIYPQLRQYVDELAHVRQGYSQNRH